MPPANNNQYQHKASVAAEAKANKTIDYVCCYQQQFDRYNQLLYAIDPLYTPESSLRTLPLYQYERFCATPSPILNCFLNRRRCEEKSGNEQIKLDLHRVKINPDGRNAFISVNGGSLYAFNTYDVSFSYTYYVRNKQKGQQQCYASEIYFPDMTNRCILGWNDGKIIFYPDILKTDKDDDKNTVQFDVVKDAPINKIIDFSDGLGIVCNETLYKINETEYQKQEQQKQKLAEKIKDACLIDKNVFITAQQSKLVLYDLRQKKQPILEVQYDKDNQIQISQIDLNRNKQLLAAVHKQEACIFDIRRLDPDADNILYKVKPQGNGFQTTQGIKVMWHPLYSNWFVTSDDKSQINFFCTDYSDSSIPFQDYDITEDNPQNQVNSICHFDIQQQDQKKDKILYSQGGIFGAHRGKSQTNFENFKSGTDFDIHPSGNQLITIGTDQELKVFTTQRFGNLGKDCFNNGDIELLEGDSQHSQGQKQYTDYTFNQPQRRDAEIKKAYQELKDCCKNNNMMKMDYYSTTAQERYILREERDVRR